MNHGSDCLFHGWCFDSGVWVRSVEEGGELIGTAGRGHLPLDEKAGFVLY